MSESESIPFPLKKRQNPNDYRDGYLAGLHRAKQIIEAELEVTETLYNYLDTAPDSPAK